MNRAAAQNHPDTLPPRVLEQAAEWVMCLHEQVGGADQQAQWQHWHDAHPDHARAWQRAERLLGLSLQVPAGLAHQALAAPASPRRRAVLRGIAAALLAPAGGWLAWQLWDAAAWDASLRTAMGERRRSQLDDGSLLQLDSDSAVDVAFDDHLRLLRLRRGQLLLETAPDPRQPPRPLVVASPHGRMQALGTRFMVCLLDDCTELSVIEGALRVSLAAAATVIHVDAGQRLRFNARTVLQRLPLGPAADAWQHGMLVADSLPLGELLARLQRYQRGWLGCEDDLQDLQVSGAFPLDDTGRSLAMLASTYGLQVQRAPGGLWTRLRRTR